MTLILDCAAATATYYSRDAVATQTGKKQSRTHADGFGDGQCSHPPYKID